MEKFQTFTFKRKGYIMICYVVFQNKNCVISQGIFPLLLKYILTHTIIFNCEDVKNDMNP